MTTQKTITLNLSVEEAKSLERLMNNVWIRTNWDAEANAYKGEVEFAESERDTAFMVQRVIWKEVRSC